MKELFTYEEFNEIICGGGIAVWSCNRGDLIFAVIL
jgi:hypothetical protein